MRLSMTMYVEEEEEDELLYEVGQIREYETWFRVAV